MKIVCIRWGRFGKPWDRSPEHILRELEKRGFQTLKVELHEIIKKVKVKSYLRLLAQIIRSDLAFFIEPVAPCFFPPFIFRKVLYLCVDPNLSPYRFRTIRRMKKPLYLIGDVLVLPRISTEIVVPGVLVEKYLRLLKVRKPITIISHGFEDRFLIDPPKKEVMRLRKKLGCDGAFVFGYLGNASQAEFFDTFLPALAIVFKKHSDQTIKIVFVGPENEARERLKKLATSAGLPEENMIYTGRIAHEDVNLYIALFDVYFNPDFGVSGLALKELMARKKAGVSLSGQTEPYIIDGFNMVFAANDVKDIAEKLDRLFSDKKYREYIASNARTSVSSFTWKAIGDKYKTLINRIISG